MRSARASRLGRHASGIGQGGPTGVRIRQGEQAPDERYAKAAKSPVRPFSVANALRSVLKGRGSSLRRPKGAAGENEVIYQVSRALYRRLGPFAVVPTGAPADRSRKHVLDACELTMRRLVEEPHFARPGRFLFEEIRLYFPLTDQAWVRSLIEVHIRFAKPLAEQARAAAPRVCGAYTRKGTPCQRDAVSGSSYCPSHRHLEGTPVANA
jgi:hypothetical protein